MKILLATNNQNKVRELKALLKGFEIICLDDIYLDDKFEVEETGSTLEKNAFIKASYYSEKYPYLIIADDSGLFVEALNGAPGVYSARYSGPDCDSRNNRLKLLKELKDINNRKAFFRCVICLIDENKDIMYFDGRVDGYITEEEDGENGFGYDSLFYANEISKTFGCASDKEKENISHRGRAIKKLVDYLTSSTFIEKNMLVLAKKILNDEGAFLVRRFLGGMSNYTYLMKASDTFYTIRVPGDYAELFVSRDKEKEDIALFEELDVTSKTIYFDTKTGVKISEYIPGESLNEIDERYYDDVALLLHTIHDSKKLSKHNYNYLERLKTYESYVNSLDKQDHKTKEEYLNVKNDFLKYSDYLNSLPLVLCHNDSQPSNFIYNKNDASKQMKIVDFEFVGNNDFIYDIACFGNMDFNDALILLEAYCKPNEVPNDYYVRLYLWRAYQSLQWYNVALFKDFMGLSKTLHIDFYQVAIMYLNNAKTLLEEVNKKTINKVC